MEEQNNRVSFRLDKKSEALSNVKKNKFGHTTTGSHEDILDDSAVQLRLGGVSGVEAYVDIFDSPSMKNFMKQNSLDVDEADPQNVEVIDLSEEIEEEISPKAFVRPQSLEEFDKIADEVMGVNIPKQKKAFAQPQSLKTCNNCNQTCKENSKFCSNCGKPFTLASFCKNCGNKFEGQEKFCSDCGAKRE